MKCFARWNEEVDSNLQFRDQTILQFGRSWDLICNFILLNPGSAKPLNKVNRNQYLSSLSLPYHTESNEQDKYLQFSIDPLMRELVKLFQAKYGSGAIRIYNLFNIREADIDVAIKMFLKFKTHQGMITKNKEIRFFDKPVIIASGQKPLEYPALEKELRKYINISPEENLYKIKRVGDKEFKISKVHPASSDIIDSYHPSHTCNYGNTTDLGDLRI